MTHSLIDYDLLSSEDLAGLEARKVTLPLKYDQLKHYLPHRYPFMLIDRVTACSPENWITGIKNITINEELFNGHFPDNPIMPGVLMVEAMAQISGVLAFISAGQTGEDGYLYLFAGVDKVRFKKLVTPGDQLVIRSKAIMNKRDIYKFSCSAHVDGQLACSAEIMIARQKVSDIA
ncbi:3-hydroxyacyl-[acyl-carrier-protein] dehydratase FabZ [Moraxella caviae]|uniref:3-hydroxyacyl-[acyl-carrier-protein] dehydratase FabZ n=1 Tax=Moraxella caviae TaxID=34060 RepID=A0A1T0A2E5_9GAMM|nr:3-hydroxyacyl-ACP dehydratase FabZ [Moraxella caviae]OOR89962.1 3-hydroxyacyl-[acyl-carrier-protein] dehydratase FabZ [Moraxella caviae]STZ14324.1 (3R)-hydroxymyristoyl-[acyl-carrier-protein] dehydratase [Moraxella caviae]